MVTGEVDPAVARDAVLEEIARLASDGVTAEELAAAHQQLMNDLVFAVEGNLSLALIMGRDELYHGQPDRVNGAIPRVLAVTAEDVQRAAQTYLITTNMTEMLVRPQSAESDAEEGDQ